MLRHGAAETGGPQRVAIGDPKDFAIKLKERRKATLLTHLFIGC
jgi:hypothetical protein